MVIFYSGNFVLYTFNETAFYIFSKLKVRWEKEKIIENMVKKYAPKQDRIEKDFNELVEDLKRKKKLF